MTSSFRTLTLSPDTLNNLDQLGYNEMTPIQAASLPLALAGQDVTGSGDAADERSLSGETPHVEGDEAERSTDPDQQWFWAEAVAWADDQAARTSSLGRVQRTVEDFARGMGLDVSSRRKRRVMRRGMLLPSTSGNGQGPQTPRLSGGARLGGVAGVAGGQRVGVELPAIRPGSHSSL